MYRLPCSAASMGPGTTYFPFSNLYCSFKRPVMRSIFSASRAPKSPVLKKRFPSTNVITSSVASLLFRYPIITLSPLTQISPSVPAGISFPPSMILTSTPSSGIPTVPSRRSLGSGELTAINGEVSVKPYPSQIGIPMLSKNFKTSIPVAAPPTQAMRIFPPMRSRILERTTLSRTLCCKSNQGPGVCCAEIISLRVFATSIALSINTFFTPFSSANFACTPS
mmetsp:Transcript_25595/g.33489  ORF Transcript_25595/g.33489 Transcript_25595/m.33489 type:complete len:223 (-) Transcript_25595:1240-1908(-)